jgi:hypothetical protein
MPFVVLTGFTEDREGPSTSEDGDIYANPLDPYSDAIIAPHSDDPGSFLPLCG